MKSWHNEQAVALRAAVCYNAKGSDLRRLAGGEVAQALLLDPASNLCDAEPLRPHILQHLVGCALDSAQPEAGRGNKGHSACIILDDVLALGAQLGLGATSGFRPLLA